MDLNRQQEALVALGQRLTALGYEFVSPTPATHALINSRPANLEARSLADVFGWSRPFAPEVVPADVMALCREADVVFPAGALLKSAVRWSTCAGRLFVHSAFPTQGRNAVFFGPDSYRFVALLLRTVWKAHRLIDVGCGSGVGALALAHRVDGIVLADVNPWALRMAAVNARLGGHGMAEVELVGSDALDGVDGTYDAVIANPPYLVDEERRTYRDGGGPLGIDLAVRIATQAIARLAPGGQFVLYTGTPIVAGRPVVCDELEPALRAAGGRFAWELLDPDVFSEELSRPAYAAVERIAVYGLVYAAP